MSATGMLMRWLPTLLVILVNAVALTEAGAPPATGRGRRVWMIAILLCGVCAIGATVWQSWEAADRMARDAAATRDLTAAVHQIRSEDRRELASLAARADALEQQLAHLKDGTPARVVDPRDANRLSRYLAGFGSHKVVVSCIPDDIEAYDYATQLVNIMKAAQWQAEGPEATRIFGDVRAIDVGLYVGGGGAPDTAKIIGDAFTRFNIPYHGQVAPSELVAQDDAVELFVGALPSALPLSGSDAPTGSDAPK